MKAHYKSFLKSSIIGILFLLNIQGTTGWFNVGPKIVAKPDKSRHVSRLNLADFLMLSHSKNAMLIDLRPVETMRYGKIPNAITIDMLDFNNLSADVKNIVAYGNRSSAETQRQLDNLVETISIPIAYYVGGWEEWLSCGLPIEKMEEAH